MNEFILDAVSYLPEFFRVAKNNLMVDIVDKFNLLLSEQDDSFKQIYEAYNDCLYKIRDYSMLSEGAKKELLLELGFDYILDILELAPTQLTSLTLLLNMIYSLKGKREGLDLVLTILGLDYKYITWNTIIKDKGEIPTPPDFDFQRDTRKLGDCYSVNIGTEEDPFMVYYMWNETKWVTLTDIEPYKQEREEFTAKLIVSKESIKQTTQTKLSDFCRAYMLPLIYIEIDTELLFKADPLYVSAGFPGKDIKGNEQSAVSRIRYTKPFSNITR